MLLGQVVAISFAQNLFFATVLVSRQPNSEDGNEDDEYSKDFAWSPPLYCEVVPVVSSVVSTVAVPAVTHTKYFMATLLFPHLLLFVPAILRPGCIDHDKVAVKPRKNAHDADNTTRRYVVFFQLFIAVCVIVQAHSTFLVLQDAETSDYSILARKLLSAIYEHPAVSSVSWDVIYCTVTAVAWFSVNGADSNQMLGA